MRKNSKIKDKKLLAVLKANSFPVKNDTVDLNDRDFDCPESKILDFAYFLLGEFLPKKTIKEVYIGLGKYHNGLTSMYKSCQISMLVDLYFDLKNDTKLFEIGTKRCDKDKVIKILEEELGEKLTPIGTALVNHTTYNMLEAKQSGVLLSTYIHPEERWVMIDQSTGKELNGVVICNSSYIGIIVPGFDLCHKLAKALYKRVGNTEIEWPYNRLGAIDIRDLTKENITPEQAEKNKGHKDWNKRSIFMLQFKKKPKVLSLV